MSPEQFTRRAYRMRLKHSEERLAELNSLLKRAKTDDRRNQIRQQLSQFWEQVRQDIRAKKLDVSTVRRT